MIKNDLNTLELTAREHSPIMIDGTQIKGITSFSIENTMDNKMVILNMKMVINLKDGEGNMKEAPTVTVQEPQKIMDGNETLKDRATFIPVIHVRGPHISEEKANAVSKAILRYVSSLFPEKTESLDSK